MTTQKTFFTCVFLVLVLPLGQMVLHFTPPQRLNGVQEKSPPPVLRLAPVLSGEFRDRSREWFNQNYGFHDYLLKTDHQFLFSLWGDVKNREGIILGRNGQLLNDVFIKIGLQYDPPVTFDRTARSLARLSRLLERRGHHLLVLVAPTKSSFYPANIPSSYARFPHYTPGADRRNFVETLRRSGVPILDAWEILAPLARSSPRPFFTQGGIHWTDEGAALTAQVLLKEMERLSGRSIGKIEIGPVEEGTPTGTDADYAYLLNLWRPPLDYPGVKIHPTALPGRDSGRLCLTMEGDSFSTQIYSLFWDLGLFKRTTGVWYGHDFTVDPRLERVPMGNFRWKEQALDRDFLVLEVSDIRLQTDDPDLIFGGFPRELLRRLGDRKGP